MKKFLSLSLSLLLLLSFALPAFAAQPEDDDITGYNWSIDSAGTLTIVGYGEMPDYDDVRPPWYSQAASIRKIVVQEGITELGDWAFADCTELQSVSLPQNTLREIGEYVFNGCAKLTALYVPPSVRDIDDEAFLGAANLTLYGEDGSYVQLFAERRGLAFVIGAPPAGDPAPPVEEPTPPVENPTPPVENPTPPVAAAGWVKSGENWFYYNADGSLFTGWLKDSGNWYYLDAAQSGAMRQGWLGQGGAVYFLNYGSGAMAKGWTSDSGNWYYFDWNTGIMKIGWLYSANNWYYLDWNGAMVTRDTVIDGVTHRFDQNGIWLGAA